MRRNVRGGLCFLIGGFIISLAGCHMGGGGGGNNDKDWSFIQIGDLHSGYRLAGPSWTNTINSILASNQAWNLKLVVSPGDCYEQDTNSFSWTKPSVGIGASAMTNGMWRVKQAGISWMNVPGNHDSDVDLADPVTKTNIIYWNDVFGMNFYASDPYWFANRVPGDTRDVAFKFTIGSTKMLFVGLRWVDASESAETFDTTNDVFTAYSTNCAWASNLARAYPDHLVVPVMHYFVDTNGTPSTKDLPTDSDDPHGANQSYINEGPGIVAWSALKSLPNVMMFLSGHVRDQPMVRSTLIADDGHLVESIKFNTQTLKISNPTDGTNINGGTFVLYTVSPANLSVHARVYNSDYGRFMTNGEFSNQGFVNDWTFPFKKLP